MMTTRARAGRSATGGDPVEEVVEAVRGEATDGLLVALHPPPVEVVVDRTGRGLDEAPQRPAVLRAQRLQVDPGAEGGVLRRPARDQLVGLLPAEAALGGGVAELEGRVVVAGVLVVDQPHPLAVVDEVAGQQVVVARDRGRWTDRERAAYALPLRREGVV